MPGLKHFLKITVASTKSYLYHYRRIFIAEGDVRWLISEKQQVVLAALAATF